MFQIVQHCATAEFEQLFNYLVFSSTILELSYANKKLETNIFVGPQTHGDQRA